MHEFSLVGEMVELLRVNAHENGIQKIHSVKVVLGEMAMILPDALKKAFYLLTTSDPLFAEDLEVAVEERKAIVKCACCGRTWHFSRSDGLTCPDCRNSKAELVSGRELHIEYYTGDS